MSASNVRYYSHALPGLSTMTSDPYTLIRTLKETICSDGFNQQSITSIEVDADGIATATLPSNTFYNYYHVTFEGANETVLNDDFIIIEHSSTWFKFKVEGTGAFTATGTITAKYSGLGEHWDILEDQPDNHAIIWSKHPSANGIGLYIQDDKDTGYDNNNCRAHWAKVWGIESWTDIDSRGAAFGGWQWFKHNSWGGKNVQWWVVADERLFYIILDARTNSDLISSYGNYYSGNNIYAFGDIESFQYADDFATILICGSDDLSNSTSSYYKFYSRFHGKFSQLNASGYKYIARNNNQITRNESIYMHASGISDWLGGTLGCPSIPSLSGNKLWTSDILINDSNSIRGRLPGCIQGMHSSNFQTPYWDESRERWILGINCSIGANRNWNTYNISGDAQALFDISGPWR